MRQGASFILHAIIALVANIIWSRCSATSFVQEEYRVLTTVKKVELSQFVFKYVLSFVVVINNRGHYLKCRV